MLIQYICFIQQLIFILQIFIFRQVSSDELLMGCNRQILFSPHIHYFSESRPVVCFVIDFGAHHRIHATGLVCANYGKQECPNTGIWWHYIGTMGAVQQMACCATPTAGRLHLWSPFATQLHYACSIAIISLVT